MASLLLIFINVIRISAQLILPCLGHEKEMTSKVMDLWFNLAKYQGFRSPCHAA